jgi:CTP:molybdopterin cytidylyltransferase MocA
MVKPVSFGILLAAGRGRRMGGNKQFHIVQTANGEKPLVAAAFDTIAPTCETMVVVLGHRAEEVAATLGERRFEIVLSDPDAPMFDSIIAGLSHALSRRTTFSGFRNPPPRPLPRPTLPVGGCLLPSLREGRPPKKLEMQRAGEGGLILQLGDHPSLNATTLNQILITASEHPGKAIMPTYQANGGHPVLIPFSIAKQIIETPCPDGLRGFWQNHPELCVRLKVNDPSVINDIDTI